MQLEAEKKYVDRRGRVYGPLKLCSVYFGESTGHAFWDSSGSVLRGCKSDLDLVAEYVEPAPVESPDDWVIFDQTIYADHLPRVGIDQFQGWEDKWTDQEYFHSKQPIGAWYVATGGNQTRCRRKDLPPIPPKTRTITLKEYACWDDATPEAVCLNWQTDEMVGHDEYTAFDNEHATGNERTINIPL